MTSEDKKITDSEDATRKIQEYLEDLLFSSAYMEY
ncbi:hypothetical protein Toce_2136 [Thermosediminibacter oceani DSM 16646]|uniref:Uncharacterized protein n=1 Tax=Thermosediminibacter oceani (strain ATCC BAA-1034 / DSM 16646 / JW/IW-1228P) TaxID=555079 RepID=D9S0J2_THEOJ|nr:hypothetical protein Toce_2136 [Thermosediminibacter oceani DSM 16646]